MCASRQYSQEEVDKKIEAAKDQISYRVNLDNRLDAIEDTLEKLIKLPEKCKCEWRKDILWFCGIPASCFGGVLLILNALGKL